MRSKCWLLALVSLLALAACAPNPPPRWAEGGAPLLIEPARWERPDDDTIEILPDGKVIEDGDVILVVDRAGRVVDEDYEPVAILLPDGHVAGTDDRLLGRIGMANAAPPGRASAWLAIMPNGQVVRFDDEGERADAGVWYGCTGAAMRTCTLVSHILEVQAYLRRPRSSIGVGVGFGVGY
jgi:hypothetical protein